MGFRDADVLGVFLTSFANVDVTIEDVTSRGILDVDPNQVLPGESMAVNQTGISVQVKTGIFPGLALKAGVTLVARTGHTLPIEVSDGFKVRHHEPEAPDGALTRLWLVRA
jgi:hypothetical protein